MQFAICGSRPDASDSPAKLFEQSGLHWLKLGHEYFCHAADPAKRVDWRKVEAAGIRVREVAREAGRADAESLYLVTQEGRLFQRAHPDVPVLLDKGRYLVVSLDRRRADEIVQHGARFSLRPAARNEIIFETLTRPHAPPAADRRIKGIVDAIDRASFAAVLTELARHPTRHSLSTHFQDAARQVADRLRLMGYQVSLKNVRIPGGNTLNVIADKRGLGDQGRSLALVCAHLDSVNHPADHSQPDDPAAPAPGADDNASGSAGVLEIARVLKDQPIRHDLRLILFGGEEQDLLGSQDYVRRLPAAERARTKSVVNMDMIAVVNTRNPTVLLEGGPISKATIAGLATAAHTYTTLRVNTSLKPHDSDHVPFIDGHMPAVLTIEGNDKANENIHSANDTLNHIDHELALEILRMNTAFVAGEVGERSSS
jgi:Zn-dependent M28 family amino/carboxypeptidase